jgi:hypothetical protein
MSTTVKGIENAELVERIFGDWPSFHDAEIHSIWITRDGDSGPQLDVTIHHWKMTRELDSKGYFILTHHTLTTLRFSGVDDLRLAGFNHQNVLWELEISECEPGADYRFSVSMPTSYGCEASLRCRAIRVLSAEPYIKPDE